MPDPTPVTTATRPANAFKLVLIGKTTASPQHVIT
jgi:hypothetical protein